MLWEIERGNEHPLGTRSNNTLFFFIMLARTSQYLQAGLDSNYRPRRERLQGLEHCTEEPRSASQASTLWQQEKPGELEHSRLRNFIMKLSKGYPALPAFQMHFLCKLHKQYQDQKAFHHIFPMNHHSFSQSRCLWSR